MATVLNGKCFATEYSKMQTSVSFEIPVKWMLMTILEGNISGVYSLYQSTHFAVA